MKILVNFGKKNKEGKEENSRSKKEESQKRQNQQQKDLRKGQTNNFSSKDEAVKSHNKEVSKKEEKEEAQTIAINKSEQKEQESGDKASQLRQDVVTEDWVVIAADRGKRPFDHKKIKTAWDPDKIPDEEECLFCDPEASGQEKDVLLYNTSEGDWTLRVFPNKYPAFSRPKGGKIKHEEEGPYFWMDGIGYHEVIVTRDHYRHLGRMNPVLVAEVLDAYQTRYVDLMSKKSVRYVEIFHNHGKDVGGSIFHPHSQLVGIPVISPYTRLELEGAERYHRANKKCVYCDMIAWEEEHQKRIIFENEHFVAFCPFASRSSFEVWVLPKKHQPYFERIADEEKVAGGEALHQAIRKIGVVLGEPPYNFYLHTAPCDGNDYPHYHWHFEILPKTSIWAGFELSTGIEISAIEPEEAAKQLKEA
jgi:UDPglucose--hexose-1-phosphate uridylyltransferase